MSELTIPVEETATEWVELYPVPDEKHGGFSFDAGEQISIPQGGLMSGVQIILQADGWRAGITVTLPEGEYCRPPRISDPPVPTRSEALVNACEALIVWLSGQKEKGGKKHRKQAEALQEWALKLEKTEQESHEKQTGTSEQASASPSLEAQEAAAIEQISYDITPSAGAGGDLYVSTRTGGKIVDPPTPLHTSAIPDGELKLIPIEELHESEWNPRQYYPEAAMAELVESMRSSGFRPWLPLMVRPLPEHAWRSVGTQDAYEIGAGHRRRRAAEIAGIKLIPCIVRSMSDEQFLDVLNFDNTGREDVHPLHEAAGWRTWMERTGKGVLDIAARIGQSKEYVYQRLKYGALIEPAQKAFLDGKITAGHAILIARLPESDQAKSLKFATSTQGYRGSMPSVRELAEQIHHAAYVDLKGCPFSGTDRTLLAGAGSCEECPKRAANIPGFELEPGVDLCTDRKCYGQKLDNHLCRIREEVRAKLPTPQGLAAATVLSVSMEYSTRKKGVYNRLEWEEAEAGDKKAATAIVVEGVGTGKVLKVKLKPAGGSSVGSTMQPKADPAEVARAEEKRRATIVREQKVRRAILAAVKPKIAGLRRADIEALLVHHFEGYDVECETVCGLHDIQGGDFRGASAAMARALPKMKESDLFAVVIEATVAGELAEYSLGQAPVALLALAKRYKVDAAKIRSEMEESSKEAEGGARKEVIKKLPALNTGKLSAETRKKIAGQQKKRWAGHRKQQAAKAGKQKVAPKKAKAKK